MMIDDYFAQLASASPTPGGGSAAAMVGATGAALIAMVARITLQSAKYTAVHPQATIFAERADEIRAALRQAGRNDETAYDAVRAALALPKTTDAEKAGRAAARETALAAAAEAPLVIAELGASAALLAQAALALGNALLESDLLCAAEFALAAVNAAAANVLINHRSMSTEPAIAAQQERLWKACSTADTACAAVRASFAQTAQN